MPEGISERAQRAIVERVFPGCVVGVVRANEDSGVWPFGRLTYEANSREVHEDTIYDLASVTKSIPVASLVAMFVAEGKLQLTDRVTKYIPELQNDFGATVEDLLQYRVRGPQLSVLNYPTFEQVRTHIFEAGFDGPPGESAYTNLPAFLLGVILERAGGKILPALSHKYFFGPLHMNDTTFFPHDVSRVAPTEIIGEEEIRGAVHDESARVFSRRRRAVGHAGLFSTAPNLFNFVSALLQGTFPPVVEFARKGLGWQLEGALLGDGYMKQGESLQAVRFGKTGFTGTSVAIDIQQGIGLVILSNRTYPDRPADQSAISAFRADLANLVFDS